MTGCMLGRCLPAWFTSALLHVRKALTNFVSTVQAWCLTCPFLPLTTAPGSPGMTRYFVPPRYRPPCASVAEPASVKPATNLSTCKRQTQHDAATHHALHLYYFVQTTSQPLFLRLVVASTAQTSFLGPGRHGICNNSVTAKSGVLYQWYNG